MGLEHRSEDMLELQRSFAERFATTAKLAVQLVFDAALCGLWAGCDALLGLFFRWLEHFGLTSEDAATFHHVAGGGLLLLVAVYIGVDVIVALQDAWRRIFSRDKP